MALTPEIIGRQIEAAGRLVRKEADLALAAVHNNLQNTISALARLTGSVRTVRQQNHWLAGAASLALVLGWVGGCVIPPAVNWVVPADWHWPEQRAFSALHRNGWEAGERLLSVSEPERWNAVQAAAQMSEANSDAIAKCASRAAKRKLRSVGCTVEVGPRDY